MIEIKIITSLTVAMLEAVVSGYTSSHFYAVGRKERGQDIAFTLSLQTLDQPFVKEAVLLDAATLQHYQEVTAQGFSYAAFVGDECRGLILVEPQRWNVSLAVREFGVSAEHRRSGVGESLMSRVFERAIVDGYRCITCETQTTNFPAISFYKKMGFEIDGLDLSYYTNNDQAQDEVAIFMRKKL